MGIMMFGGLICSVVGIILILVTRHRMFDRETGESGKKDYKFIYRLGITLLILGLAAQALTVFLE
jgi:uncharacterized membrane protein